ncbi:hypothetical protein R5R35_008057 [Gryllus longicercus]|uniref:Major facilitator superfamily (MFS) profile domain-containing protein n=1 Tax=Gryllus longicercus TaxID=2509291 RepID=A0AAN9VX70_9ORTH
MELEERQPLLTPAPGANRPRDCGAGRVRQFAAAFTVDIMALAFGLGMGWSSTALPLLMSEASPLHSGPITKTDASWLASILCIMGTITTPMYHYICEHYGRKACAFATVLPGIISILLLIFGETVEILYVSRGLIGASFAGTFIYCPIYVTELAEKDIRGSLGVVIMLMRNIGILFSYIIGSYFSFHTVSWLCLGPPVIFLFALFWLPESPVYLARQGEYEKAVIAMKHFRGKNVNVPEEIEVLKNALSEMQSGGNAPATLLELLSNKIATKALFMTFILFSNQQLCGFYGIVSYTVMIFKESGSYLSPNTCSIIVGFMLFCGTVLSIILCDLTGRKILLIVSDFLMGFVLIIIAIYFFSKSRGYDIEEFNWVPVTCLSIYVIALNVGIASLPVLIATELFSPRFTSLAMTITAPSTWMLTFFVTKYFPLVSEHIGIHGSCLVFAVICIGGGIYIVLCVPETKNKSLQMILGELESKQGTTFNNRIPSKDKVAASERMS